jgi:hypothetical protein
MTKLSGGGITSNKLVQTLNPKAEPTVHNVDPRRPSMIGLSHYVGTGPLYSGQASTPQGPTQVVGAACGPGAGRQVMKSGSQSATPAPRPMGRGRPF